MGKARAPIIPTGLACQSHTSRYNANAGSVKRAYPSFEGISNKGGHVAALPILRLCMVQGDCMKKDGYAGFTHPTVMLGMVGEGCVKKDG